MATLPPIHSPSSHGDQSARQSPAGRRQFWAIALSGLLCGLLTTSAVLAAEGTRLRLYNLPLLDFLPGLGFGLVLGGWLWRTGQMRPAWLPVLALASTLAYLAAYLSAEWLDIFLQNQFKQRLGRGGVYWGSYNTVPQTISGCCTLAFGGVIGGAIGTSLLAGALAWVSAHFRRKETVRPLLLAGIIAGAGLAIAAPLAYLAHTNGMAWAYRIFIAGWQLTIAAVIAAGLGKELEGLLPAAEPGRPRPWVWRLALAEWILALAALAYALFRITGSL